jgi:uroporphyrinogen decarboxylase
MAEMTVRERYRATMHRPFDFAQDKQPGVRTPLWEFGYWTATLERWYLEGLARTPFSPPMGSAPGNGVFGGALPFPHMPGLVRYRDIDVHRRLGFDEGTVRVPVNWRLCPLATEVVLEEDETTRVMINTDGVKVKVRKANDSLPQYLAWPVHDRASWEQIKAERFGLNIQARFPDRWDVLAPAFRQRDYPLGVVMDGFFAAPRELLGVEHQLMMYYDDPGLMHDINEHLCTLWLAVLEDLLSKVDLDFVYIWEDMSFKTGPLMSPRMFKQFIIPYYKRITGFLRGRGIDIICVDTDGLCTSLIPGFIEGGVAGLYPFEVQAGMDIVEVRKQFPQLLMQGGLDKTKVALGKEAIDAELAAKLPFMLQQGGYIPFCDHMVPPDVPWENFVYYREQVRSYVERYQPE